MATLSLVLLSPWSTNLYTPSTRGLVSMPDMDRREILTGIGGIVAGGTGVFMVATDDASGTTIDVDNLEVRDESSTVSGPVNGLRISLSGTFDLESGKEPDKVVLRVKARANETNEFQQIGATDWRTGLAKGMSQQFSLEANVLDLEGVTAPGLTPMNVGESTSQNITVRLTLSVFHDGVQTHSHTVEDSATVGITKQETQTNSTISASGNFSVLSG